MSNPQIIVRPTRQTITVDGTGQTILIPKREVQILSVGVMGPVGASAEEETMPEFPVVDPKFSVDLAAGSSVNLDSIIIPAGKIGKLQQITLTCSLAAKWEIQKLTAGVPTTLDTVLTSGISGNQATHEWEPPHRNYAALTGNGVNTFFRVTASSLDARNAGNVYATYFFDEANI